MLFNEIYGCYYNTMAKIISAAIEGSLTDESLSTIVSKNAFGESILEIEPAIKERRWQLITEDMGTPILEKPQMPLTELQLRWLKTISLDPKIALFDFSFEGLEDVEPLFLPGDIVLFDQYADGDPYEAEWYKKDFRLIRQAIKEKRKIMLKYCNSRGRFLRGDFIPVHIEYSDKDDKFRIQVIGERGKATINMGRLYDCRLLDETFAPVTLPDRKFENVTFILRDERNALERALMQFAQYKKEAIKISEKEYQICVWYDKEDETDLIIQLLSFGPMIKIIGSVKIIKKIAERVKRQKELMIPAS